MQSNSLKGIVECPRHNRIYRSVPIILTLLLLLSVPSYGLRQHPTITSLAHQRVIGGDSFRIVADGPFPKAFIKSGNKFIEIEYTGINCNLPPQNDKSYEENVRGNLTDHLQVNVSGTPPKTKITFNIANNSDYSYYYDKPSPEEFDLIIISSQDISHPKPPIEIPVSRPPQKVLQPTRSIQVAPPKVIRDGMFLPTRKKTSLITKVEYFPLEDGADRIEFTFEGTSPDPEFTVRTYPKRLVITCPNAEVHLPVKTKHGPFLTTVPGRGVHQLKAWNRDSSQGGSAFELFLKSNATPNWKVDRQLPNKLRVDISFDKQVKKPAETPSLFRKPEVATDSLIEIEAYLVGGPKPGETSDESSEVVVIKIKQMEIDINWPVDIDLLLDQLRQITAGVGPGVIVEIPLKLRLHIKDNVYSAPYPKIER